MADIPSRSIPPVMARGLIEGQFKTLLDRSTFTESNIQSYRGHVNSITGRLWRRNNGDAI